ncbi:MAG: hypothetical protein K6A79_07925 [Ruminococcus sp.]|nr:hypothetical protein [Ruminococcus sp.]
MENIIVLSNAAESMKAAMYIDPASTSLIIQIVAGVVITVGTVLGIYWRKVKSAVKKKSGAEETAPKAEIKGAEAGNDVITASDLLDDDDDDEE